MNFYARKITKKFDIFYYLRQLKILKIIQKSIFYIDQIKLLNLISNKEYRVNMKDEINKNTLTEKEKNSKTLNYFINSYNPKVDSSEQKIMNYLIENN
jgi:hypothetical protein